MASQIPAGQLAAAKAQLERELDVIANELLVGYLTEFALTTDRDIVASDYTIAILKSDNCPEWVDDFLVWIKSKGY